MGYITTKIIIITKTQYCNGRDAGERKTERRSSSKTSATIATTFVGVAVAERARATYPFVVVVGGCTTLRPIAFFIKSTDSSGGSGDDGSSSGVRGGTSCRANPREGCECVPLRYLYDVFVVVVVRKRVRACVRVATTTLTAAAASSTRS